MKNIIVDLFNRRDIVDFILAIKDVDVDIITNEVLIHHDPITLDSFIFEALSRYKDIVLSKTRYRALQDIVDLSTDWDGYIRIYENGLQSFMEFSVETFVEDYELNGKLLKLAYQLKEELENFKD